MTGGTTSFAKTIHSPSERIMRTSSRRMRPTHMTKLEPWLPSIEFFSSLLEDIVLSRHNRFNGCSANFFNRHDLPSGKIYPGCLLLGGNRRIVLLVEAIGFDGDRAVSFRPNPEQLV